MGCEMKHFSKFLAAAALVCTTCGGGREVPLQTGKVTDGSGALATAEPDTAQTPADIQQMPPEIAQADLAAVGDVPGAPDVLGAADAPVAAASGDPLAVIAVQEGDHVVPQTLLHLKGGAATVPGGVPIKAYKWMVQQPEGSYQLFLPSDTVANPTFLPNAAGQYQFSLDVWNANGVKSSSSAFFSVSVLPDNAIHVELLWDTPADPSATDIGPNAGTDVDLHFAHPMAAGLDVDCDGAADPWFHQPFDTFWFNPKPGWGSADPAAGDDPTLDLDDTDGWGPENINLAGPEGTDTAPVAYSVGVHYWNDHEYGASWATVNVYLFGTLAVQLSKVEMQPRDMWYVGKINWPNQMAGAAGVPFTPCYQSGSACLAKSKPKDPAAGKMWQGTGKWCITPCYDNKSFSIGLGGAAPAACK